MRGGVGVEFDDGVEVGREVFATFDDLVEQFTCGMTIDLKSRVGSEGGSVLVDSCLLEGR